MVSRKQRFHNIYVHQIYIHTYIKVLQIIKYCISIYFQHRNTNLLLWLITYKINIWKYPMLNILSFIFHISTNSPHMLYYLYTNIINQKIYNTLWYISNSCYQISEKSLPISKTEPQINTSSNHSLFFMYT